MFKLNQVVKANKTIYFCDGTTHLKNSKHIIQKDTLDYFIINSQDYD